MFVCYIGYDTEGPKAALCLIGPGCLTQSLTTLQQYEDAQIGFQWDNIGDVCKKTYCVIVVVVVVFAIIKTYNYWRITTCLVMMFVDTILYLLCALYFDQVWPSAFGQSQPWYFLFLKSYWSPQLQSDDSLGEGMEMRLLNKRVSFFESDRYELVCVSNLHTVKSPPILHYITKMFLSWLLYVLVVQ